MHSEQKKRPAGQHQNWEQSEINNIQELLNALENYNLLKFFVQIFGVIALGTLIEQFATISWINTLVNTNTVLMTLSYLGLQFGLRGRINQALKHKSLVDCLWLQMHGLYGEQESISIKKMLSMQKEAGSWAKFLENLGVQITALKEDKKLLPYQKSKMLKKMYQNLKELRVQRPYSSFFFRLLTGRPQQALSKDQLAPLWDSALACGDIALILEIISDTQNQSLPFSQTDPNKPPEKQLWTEYMQSSLKDLFGEENVQSVLGQYPEKKQGPAPFFPGMAFWAKLSNLIGLWLIEPLAKVNNNLQRSLYAYQQAGLIVFSSTMYITAPVTIFLGMVALIFLFRQAIEQYMYVVARRNSFERIIQAYAQCPEEHYERLLFLKVRSLMRPSVFRSAFLVASFTPPAALEQKIPFEGLNESQCFKLYQIILENYRRYHHLHDDDPQKLQLGAVIPMLTRLHSTAQLQMYLQELRPIGSPERNELLQALYSDNFALSEQIKNLKEQRDAASSDLKKLKKSWKNALPLESKNIPASEAINWGITLSQYSPREENEQQMHMPLNLSAEHQSNLSEFVERRKLLQNKTKNAKTQIAQLEKQQAFNAHLRQSILDLPSPQSSELKLVLQKGEKMPQDNYESLRHNRRYRDTLMAHIFPFSTISGSVLTAVFYFIPITIMAAALIYTIAPAALLVLAVLATAATYKYLSSRENALLDKLSLSDFYGQNTDEMHLRLVHSKIQRLENTASEEDVSYELQRFSETLLSHKLMPCDAEFLSHILPALEQLSNKKGSGAMQFYEKINEQLKAYEEKQNTQNSLFENHEREQLSSFDEEESATHVIANNALQQALYYRDSVQPDQIEQEIGRLRDLINQSKSEDLPEFKNDFETLYSLINKCASDNNHLYHQFLQLYTDWQRECPEQPQILNTFSPVILRDQGRSPTMDETIEENPLRKNGNNAGGCKKTPPS